VKNVALKKSIKFLPVIALVLVMYNFSPAVSSADTYKQLDLFGEVFERVREEFVEEKKDSELIESAINGMLGSLDPHSKYLNPKNLQEMRVQTKGEFGGLGIEVTMESGFVKVIAPIDDTPAYRAGIKAGDFITHLDGEPILGKSLSEAVELMRGRINTKIKLTVQRVGVDDSFDVTIIRDKIKIDSIKVRIEGEDLVYVRVTAFSERTSEDLKNSLKEVFSENESILRGIILDLRNNPGGLLDQAIAVSDVFLAQGEIVTTRGRDAETIQRFNSRKGDIAEGLPMIVLINSGSASASEIVAGAIQDHRRGLILGTRSFGKGSVQTIIPLKESGAIRLTTARYFTPSGRSIQAKGIEPDIIVEQAKLEKLVDARQRESDLPGSLGAIKDVNGKSKGSKGIKEKAIDSVNEEVDYQLIRAIDLLRGHNLLSLTDPVS
tara:strand:- start:4496 stop:5803 length:1308 start_codon:yes stop_codon:yes gene_type:complete